METRVIDYQVIVKGVATNGHPEQKITNSLHDACQIFDLYKAQYPDRTIFILETTQRVLAKVEPEKKKPPKPSEIECPKGHSGSTDGRPNIVNSSNGTCYCTVCGDFFTAQVQ